MHSIQVICLFKTQVNIVTTRSNINSSHTKFSKGVHNSNYYAKFQNNFYNNQQFQNTHNRFRPQNKNNNNRKQPMVTIHVSIRNTCKITWSCIILDSFSISECMLTIQRCEAESIKHLLQKNPTQNIDIYHCNGVHNIEYDHQCF